MSSSSSSSHCCISTFACNTTFGKEGGWTFLQQHYINHDLLVIDDTGTGKTTTLALFYAYDAYKQHTTRLAANQVMISIPTRTSAMYMTTFLNTISVREVGVELFGYAVRGEKYIPPYCCVLFATPGWFVAKLLNDPHFAFSTFVLDEAHDPSIDTYFLRKLLRYRRNMLQIPFRMVISSATLTPVSVLNDFPDLHQYTKTTTTTTTTSEQKEQHQDTTTTTTTMNFIGVDYVHKVELSMLEDISKTVHQMHQESPFGTKLIFLDGEDSIYALRSHLYEIFTADEMYEVDICVLYSNMDSDERRKTLSRSWKSKIILCTNMVESSITIPRVTHTISCTWHRVMYTLENGAQELRLERCSQQNLLQQVGRANRDPVYDAFGQRVQGYGLIMCSERVYQLLPKESVRSIDTSPPYRVLLDLIRSGLNPYLILNDIRLNTIHRHLQYLLKYGLIATATTSSPSSSLSSPSPSPSPSTTSSQNNQSNQKNEEIKEDCSICYDVGTEHQKWTVLPCKHTFHEVCVYSWFKRLQDEQCHFAPTCPMCRQPVTDHHPFMNTVSSEMDWQESLLFIDPTVMYEITEVGQRILCLPISIQNGSLLYKLVSNTDIRSNITFLHLSMVIIALMELKNSRPFYYPPEKQKHLQTHSEIQQQYMTLRNKHHTQWIEGKRHDIEMFVHLYYTYMFQYERHKNRTTKQWYGWLQKAGLYSKFFDDWYAKVKIIHYGLAKLQIHVPLHHHMHMHNPIVIFPTFEKYFWKTLEQHGLNMYHQSHYKIYMYIRRRRRRVSAEEEEEDDDDEDEDEEACLHHSQCYVKPRADPGIPLQCQCIIPLVKTERHHKTYLGLLILQPRELAIEDMITQNRIREQRRNSQYN